MRTRTLRLVLLSTIATLGSFANADAPDARYCEVAIDLSIDGHPVAAPSAILEFGKDAEITMGDEAEHAWRFHIVADAPTVIRRVNAIPLSVELYEVAKGQSFLRASPHLNVAPGQRADFETIFGGGDGRKAHVALVANLRSAADVETLQKDAQDAN